MTSDDVEVTRRDRIWGPGNWVVHEGCPDAAIAGQDRAVHHRDYHGVSGTTSRAVAGLVEGDVSGATQIESPCSAKASRETMAP